MSAKASTILIADDERPLARAMEMKLSSSGFTVLVANDGREAMDKLKEHSDIDLLLLDLIMPREDGFAVLEFMKKEGIKVPVFVMTNLGQAEDIARAKSYGAAGYFVKADTPLSTIVEKVRAKLGEH